MCLNPAGNLPSDPQGRNWNYKPPTLGAPLPQGRGGGLGDGDEVSSRGLCGVRFQSSQATVPSRSWVKPESHLGLEHCVCKASEPRNITALPLTDRRPLGFQNKALGLGLLSFPPFLHFFLPCFSFLPSFLRPFLSSFFSLSLILALTLAFLLPSFFSFFLLLFIYILSEMLRYRKRERDLAGPAPPRPRPFL